MLFRVKVHKCFLLLDFLALFWLYRTHALIFWGIRGKFTWNGFRNHFIYISTFVYDGREGKLKFTANTTFVILTQILNDSRMTLLTPSTFDMTGESETKMQFSAMYIFYTFRWFKSTSMLENYFNILIIFWTNALKQKLFESNSNMWIVQKTLTIG